MNRTAVRTLLTRRGFVHRVGAAAVVGGLGVAMSRSPRTLGAPFAAQAEGTLVVGAPGDRYISEPPLPNVAMTIPNPNVFETLVMLDADFKPTPGLAETWEFIAPNTWRFTLRQGVVFHDGTPFTAEAVVWTMARVAASGGGVLGVDENSTKAIDDHTVEITPAIENRRLPLQMSAPRTGSIIAPGTDVAEVRIGTGPFREVEYAPEEHYLAEAYADYWGDRARVERIDFRFLPDPTTRLLALEAGEVDIIYDVPREAALGLAEGGVFTVVTSGVGAYQAINITIHGAAPYDLGQDPVIREAVALAIDRQIIAEAAWQGYAEAENTMVPPAVLGDAAADVTTAQFDPEAARQRLEEAGWIAGGDGIRERDGRRLSLEMVVGYPSAEIQGTMPELVQAQLRDIGIEMTIVQTPDAASYNDRLVALEGDLWAEVGNQVDADPCYLPDLLFSSPDPDVDPDLNSYGNAFAPGAGFDAAIAECSAATTTEDVQLAAAKALNILTSQNIMLPLVGIHRIYAHAPRVEGFAAHPVQFLQRWNEVSLAGGE